VLKILAKCIISKLKHKATLKKFKFCLTNLNTKVYQLYLKQNTNQNLFAYVRFYSTKLFVSELWKRSDTQKCIKEMQDWRRERKCNQKLPRCKFIRNASKFRTCGSGLRSPISFHLVFQVTNKLKKGSWTSYLLFLMGLSYIFLYPVIGVFMFS